MSWKPTEFSQEARAGSWNDEIIIKTEPPDINDDEENADSTLRYDSVGCDNPGTSSDTQLPASSATAQSVSNVEGSQLPTVNELGEQLVSVKIEIEEQASEYDGNITNYVSYEAQGRDDCAVDPLQGAGSSTASCQEGTQSGDMAESEKGFFFEANAWSTGDSSANRRNAVTQRHFKTGNDNMGFFSCTQCRKLFMTKSGLFKHTKLHGKSFTCSECRKSFATHHHLTDHLMLHVGEKPHVCSVCGQDFPLEKYLKRHFRAKHKEQPHLENYRQIETSSASDSSKKFSCQVCGSKFKLEVTLNLHMDFCHGSYFKNKNPGSFLTKLKFLMMKSGIHKYDSYTVTNSNINNMAVNCIEKTLSASDGIVTKLDEPTKISDHEVTSTVDDESKKMVSNPKKYSILDPIKKYKQIPMPSELNNSMGKPQVTSSIPFKPAYIEHTDSSDKMKYFKMLDLRSKDWLTRGGRHLKAKDLRKFKKQKPCFCAHGDSSGHSHCLGFGKDISTLGLGNKIDKINSESAQGGVHLRVETLEFLSKQQEGRTTYNADRYQSEVGAGSFKLSSDGLIDGLMHMKKGNNVCKANKIYDGGKKIRQKEVQKNESKSKKFTCKICGDSFAVQLHLARHCRVEHVKIPNHEMFMPREVLSQVHQGTKSENQNSRIYKCNLCKQICTSKIEYSFHMKICLLECVKNDAFYDAEEFSACFSCKVCKKGFTTQQGLHNHYRIHEVRKPHICKVCRRVFTQKHLLESHLQTHTRYLMCNVCKEIFTSKVQYALHVKQCVLRKIDGTGFKRNHALNLHHNCQLCNLGFSSELVLAAHMRVHIKDKFFLCELCGQVFPHALELNMHAKASHGVSGFLAEEDYEVDILSCSDDEDAGRQKPTLVSKAVQVDEMLIDREDSSLFCKVDEGALTAEVFLNVCVSPGGEQIPRSYAEYVDTNAYHCHSCNENFATYKDLKNHAYEERKFDPRLYLCEFCGSCFDDPEVSVVHSCKNDSQAPLQVDEIRKSLQESPERKKNDKPKYICCMSNMVFFQKQYPRASADIWSKQKLHHVHERLMKIPKKKTVFTQKTKHKSLYLCYVCNKLFSKKFSLFMHFRVHKRTMICVRGICGKPFETEEEITKHLVKHESKESGLCKICGQVCLGRDDLIKHVGAVHNSQHVTLSAKKLKRCYKLYEESCTLKKNYAECLAQYSKPSVSCEMCGMPFVNMQELIDHSMCHVNCETIVCDVCGLDFSNYNHFLRHTENHCNGNERAYLCTVCKSSYDNSEGLNFHVRSHIDNRVFSCSKCGELFWGQQTLKVHKESTLVKCGHKSPSSEFENEIQENTPVENVANNLECEVCNQTFKNKELLSQHVLSHLL